MATRIITDDRYYLDPQCLMMQAITVSKAAHHESDKERSGQYWGLHMLVESLGRDMDAILKSPNDETYDRASNSLAGALSLLEDFNDESVDDSLLYTLGTLLFLTKVMVDQAWEVLEFGELQPA